MAETTQFAFAFEAPRRILGVRQLNAEIRDLLAAEFSDVWVTGEISGVRLAASGHYYFALKEEDATLRCACFRMTARYLRFKPQDGMAVLARGRIDVYEARGEYQLIVETLEPRGYGGLQLAFEQLKAKLAAEGLFDAQRKRPLPPFPRRIGIVTSPQGAVIHDLLQVLGRRFPGLHVRLYPVLVQGDGSAKEIAAGLGWFSRSPWADVVILARGGGSLEDLWSFNEEAVARAIAACPVPVISAVGHETDFTIADFVADLRAPTPSAAAELAVRTRAEVLGAIDTARLRLGQLLRYQISEARRELEGRGAGRAAAGLRLRLGRLAQRLDDLDYRLRDTSRERIARSRDRLEALEVRLLRLDYRVRCAAVRTRLELAQNRLEQAMRLRLTVWRGRLEGIAARIENLSPLRVLERGYALVENEAGQLVRQPPDAPLGSTVKVRLARGRLMARVTGSHED